MEIFFFCFISQRSTQSHSEERSYHAAVTEKLRQFKNSHGGRQVNIETLRSVQAQPDSKVKVQDLISPNSSCAGLIRPVGIVTELCLCLPSPMEWLSGDWMNCHHTGGLFMAYSESMKELVNREHFTDFSHTFYHCKPRIGIRCIIAAYCKLVLT